MINHWNNNYIDSTLDKTKATCLLGNWPLSIHVRRLDMHFLTTSWKRYCSRINSRIYPFFSSMYIIAVLYCFVRRMMMASISMLEVVM